MENCSRIKDENGKLVQGEDGVQKIWNIDIQEQVESTCVALTGFGEVTTSEESQWEELRLDEIEQAQ